MCVAMCLKFLKKSVFHNRKILDNRPDSDHAPINAIIDWIPVVKPIIIEKPLVLVNPLQNVSESGLLVFKATGKFSCQNLPFCWKNFIGTVCIYKSKLFVCHVEFVAN